MYLCQLDMAGFRGIERLSIKLRPNMLLIGENVWGKSSLLAALSLILNTDDKLYQFVPGDFHFSAEQHRQSKQLTLLFTFSEREINAEQAKSNSAYRQLLVPHEDGYHRLYLRVTGYSENQHIVTSYSFLDSNGDPISLVNTEELVLNLIARHRVYRFRDARLNERKAAVSPSAETETDELAREFQAVVQLIRYYFIGLQNGHTVSQDLTALWQHVKSLCVKLRQDPERRLQQRLIEVISALFVSDNRFTDKRMKAQPILLFEDLDSRLHPRMTAIIWELTNYLPIQRITTTNSVELVSLADLRTICRLVRYSDKTRAYQLTRHDLGKEDLRRLTFHIHHNRSLALFSRSWILVEGETEVWILSELAKLLDIHLAMEGIRIVEFAQSGLRPLIKYAQAMGIEWYVLTDGDEAGRKYAETVRNMLTEEENLSNRLTMLPKSDIEHFFYSQGFEQVFIRLARWQAYNNHYPIHKIIQRAIQRTSKPDLAIALSAEIENRGSQSIPLLFKRLFLKVLYLTRTQY